MARQRKEKTEATSLLDFAVQYGQVSIGDKTARIGVTIDRALLKLPKADSLFCGKRLAGKITSKPHGSQNGQGNLPGMNMDTELAGVFDVKSFGVTSKQISLGLTFSLGNLDLATLGHFAKRAGSLTINDINEIPAKQPGEEPDEDLGDGEDDQDDKDDE